MDKDEVEYLIDVFKDAKEYGAILNVKEIDFEALERRIEEIQEDEDISNMFYIGHRDILLEQMPILVKQMKFMIQTYDIVITNPPYMGRKA